MARTHFIVATTIFVFVNVAVFLFLYLVAAEYKAGDVLGFEGALIGVAGAVLGSIYVEDWKRRSQERENSAVAIECLSNIDGSIADDEGKSVPQEMNRERIARILYIFQEMTSRTPPRRTFAIYQANIMNDAIEQYLYHVSGMVIAGVSDERQRETWDEWRARNRTAREAVQKLIRIYQGEKFKPQAITS